MKIAVFLFSLVWISVANGGDKAGNGGNVVLCKGTDGKITSVKMLDYYEAEIIWGFQLDLGDLQLDPQLKVQNILERTRRFHPLTADALEKRAAGFFDDALMLSDVELTPVDDSGEYFLPTGCQLKQIAVQRQKEFPEDKTFLINKDVWNLLDNNQRAGLILHEIIYEKMLLTHNTNPDLYQSRTARFFNALISSAGFQQLTLDQYLPILHDVWFVRDLIYQGYVLTDVGTSGTGMEGRLPANPQEIKLGDNMYPLVPLALIGWWKADVLSFANFTVDVPFKLNGQVIVAESGHEVSFFPDGSLQALYLAGPEVISVRGASLSMVKNSAIRFSQSGNPLRFTPTEEWEWNFPGGSIWSGTSGRFSAVELMDNGQLRSVNCPSKKHSFAVVDNRERTLTCDSGSQKCTWSQGGISAIAWPDVISFNEAGIAVEIENLDPKQSFCI